MDKRILDLLIKFGLVTNTCVDPEKYADVDDLINKGVVTIPGAKSKIMELIEKANIETAVATEDVKTTLPETVAEVKDDEIVEVTEATETEAPVEEVAETVEVSVEETTVEEVVTEEVPTEEVAETTEEVTEEAPKKKKSTKKAE